MSKNQIDKLEELIPTLVEETRQLREDNVQLRLEVKSCRSELDRSMKDREKLETKNQRLQELEGIQKRLEKDQSAIRSTVENLLQGIDKISITP